MLTLFLGLVALTASTRLIELRISQKHRKLLFAQGADAISDPGFSVMVALHVGILVSSLLEVFLLERSAILGVSAVAAVFVLLASGLRVWAISALGNHWNVRVVDSTSLGVVTTGPYRWIRHPNYVAVFVELTFLPLVHGAWLTAAIGTALHVVVLRSRILLEEEMLMRDETYRKTMASKPRFLPAF